MADPAEIRTLGDIPGVQARDNPDAVALQFGERETTYAQWERHTVQVANALLGEGAGKDHRIAFLDRNSDHYFELFFGAARAGAVMVAVNWRLAPPEIQYIIDDSQAEVLFVGREFLPAVEKVREQLGSLRKIIVMDGTEGYEDYVSWRDAAPTGDPGVSVDPHATVIQMYTSGTTGNPKGVELSHYSFLALRLAEDDPELEQWERWSSEDVSLVAMPVFHIAGTGWGLQGLYYGAHNVVVSDFVPGEVLDIIHRDRVTKLFLVPAAIQFLLLDPKCADTDFSSVRVVLYGASPIPLDLLRQAIKTFRNAGFVQLYGMTENCGQATYLPPEDHDPEGTPRMRSAGKPMRHTEIIVVDENDKKLGPHEVGEICIKSPTNMRGYWHLDEATAKTMRNGYVYTGDAGYKDDDGYVYVYDRIKDMIISGGENIYPAEIESVLYSHKWVADVAVIGVPDETWGEAVKAVIVPTPGEDVAEADILAYAREQLAGYKVPKSVDFVDELPRNPSGKLLKRQLREPYWQNRERQVN